MSVLDFEFRNAQQKEYFTSKARNNCFSGGINNGKTFIACLKMFIFLSTYPKYRVVIARQVYKDLKATTMKTFFKICPQEFVARHDEQGGVTVLRNGSEILWMHLDSYDEQAMRGLEINSALIDQAEEIDEAIFLVLDSRIGRWDQSEVPERMIKEAKKNGYTWPLDTRTGKPKPRNFFDILVNPDTQFHFVYRMFHPDSIERDKKAGWVESQTDESLGDPETMEKMKDRDPEWVDKYFRGIWGRSNAQVHVLDKQSVVGATSDVKKILYDPKNGWIQKAALYRTFDHGDSSPSCCLWVMAYRGVYIFYREYYMPKTLISQHRRNISDLSRDEYYVSSYADPSIFNMASQKNGGFWSVADEYLTSDIKAPTIAWIKADNNEFATRNRINELLRPASHFTNPFTGETPAPGIYFIKKDSEYQDGCFHSITQLQSQRYEQLGSDNGKSIYSNDRDKNVTDHAYDPIRYFIAQHGSSPVSTPRKIKQNTFAYFNAIMDSRKNRKIGANT